MSATAANKRRTILSRRGMPAPPFLLSPIPAVGFSRCRVSLVGGTCARLLRRDRLAVGGLPAPGAGAIAALEHAFLVDLGDDLAVAGEQRFGRAHLGAE